MDYRRFILIVLDSVGIGAMPDAARFGDAGSDTLGNILARRPVALPNLARLGLGNIRPFPRLEPSPSPTAAYGMAALASNGKDTTSGHWELAGVVLGTPFPTYPDGFPPHIMETFEEAIGTKTLGNCAASGTEIIARLGEEHLRTGYPIVYTSADSVFQIAAHEEVLPVAELYRLCELARELLQGPDEVGRVIARPFVGSPGAFTRTARRRDYAIPPPGPTLLDVLSNAGQPCVAVGKIASIYCGRGVTREVRSANNEEGVERTLEMMVEVPQGLIFTNLVDFDMLYGHRNDVDGYARALEAFDRRLPELQAALRSDDCLILTADHGCDPTTPSTDHSREYVPILACGPRVQPGAPLGVRRSLADVGQTVAENFGLKIGAGASFLAELTAAAPRRE